MMCILSLDRPVLRKWFHVWIIFTFFAGLLVIVCDKILLLRWYYCCLSFIFTNAFLFLTWPLTPWVLFALRMPCEWKEMHYCLFTRWKKKWNFIVNVFEHVADVRIWIFVFKCRWISYLQPSTVFLFHMKLFFSNNSFYWLFHFSTWRKILLNINKIITKNQSFVRYLFYCIFC